MQNIVDDADTVMLDRIGRKLMIGLVVPVALVSFINAIDRVNVSYAGHAMTNDLGLAPDQFGFGVSVFFIAYLVFQYPHARLLRALGIRLWLFLSMILWGVSGIWMSRVQSAEEFYAARFLLGMAEAGLAPGMTWFITRWTPPQLRARAMAGVLTAVPLSMVLGGPLCGWLLGLDNSTELESWRFMFLMLAVPNFILAVAAAFYFVDRPEKARWLSQDERAWLQATLDSSEERPGSPRYSTRRIMQDPWLWRCSLTWLLMMTGSYALVFWLPQLVRQMGVGGTSELAIGTLSALPLLGLALGLIVNGRRSDHKGERLLHVGVPSAAAGLAMMVAAALPPGWPVLALLVVAGFGLGAAQGVFWTVPSAVRIGGDRPPVGVIALISMFGAAGGIIGPSVTGVLVAHGGGYSTAIAVLATLLVVALFIIGFDPSGRSRRQAAVNGKAIA
jgi:ACS family tartrate transporter-like MFS transporter